MSTQITNGKPFNGQLKKLYNTVGDPSPKQTGFILACSVTRKTIGLKYSIGDTTVIWQMNKMFSTCNTGGGYSSYNKPEELYDKDI